MALKPQKNKHGIIRDPYKKRQAFEKWDRTLPDANPQDEAVLLEYLQDKEQGYNVGGSRGARTISTIQTARSRMCRISQLVQYRFKKNLLALAENPRDIHTLFDEMRKGKITKDTATNTSTKYQEKTYGSTADYEKHFTTFWHWLMRRERKTGRELLDITQDLDKSRDKPKFHYKTQEEIKTLADAAKYEYRVLIWFLFDTGMRPSEMMNVRAKDLELSQDGIYNCTIREETSKTFGRKIKLMLCSNLLKEYLHRQKLKGEAFIWNTSMTKTGQYIKRLGQRVFNVPDFSMYDLRHSSACYWLPRYKSESALKYRFGWQKSEMIHYYTELLGMKDTITQEDLIDSEEKTRLQKELDTQKQQLALMQEQMQAQQRQVEEMLRATGILAQARAEYDALAKQK